MNQSFESLRSEFPRDPRQRKDFCSKYYPKANGGDGPPPDSAARNDGIMSAFRAAYYGLNCEHARLRELRAATGCVDREKAEKECLRAIEKALIIRDGLEDRLACFGVIAEPIVEDGFAVDLKFTFGDVTAAGRRRSELLVSSADIAIGLPLGVKRDRLTLPKGSTS